MINDDTGICVASTGLQSKMMSMCVGGRGGGGSQTILQGCVKVLWEVSL